MKTKKKKKEKQTFQGTLESEMARVMSEIENHEYDHLQ
jgi:hypothetical protein